MRETLPDLHAVGEALRSWLETATGVVFGLGDTPDVPPCGVLDMLGRPSEDQPFTPGTVFAQQVQVTFVAGRDDFERPAPVSQAVAGGQRVARALAGRDNSGSYLEHLDLSAAGVAVRRRRSNGDGHCDRSGVLPCWVETFTLDMVVI